MDGVLSERRGGPVSFIAVLPKGLPIQLLSDNLDFCLALFYSLLENVGLQRQVKGEESTI